MYTPRYNVENHIKKGFIEDEKSKFKYAQIRVV